MDWSAVATLSLCLLLLPTTHSYSSGAPDGSVCSSLLPGHGARAQGGVSGYTIKVKDGEGKDVTIVKPGDAVTVHLEGAENQFKGFILTPRLNYKPVGGAFRGTDLAQVRCQNGAVTHRDPTPKDAITVSWTAPADMDSGDLYFVATVVKTKVQFWTEVKSETMLVEGNNAAKPDEYYEDEGDYVEEDYQEPQGNTQAYTVEADPNCHVTKGCFHNCNTGGPCTYSITWHPERDSVVFEMRYNLKEGKDEWISMGLSRDRFMGDDSCMDCIKNGDSVFIRTSYNKGHFNEFPDDKEAGLTSLNGSVADGVLRCRFRRALAYPIEPKVFDLSQSWFLMVAHGEALNGGQKFPHSYAALPQVSKTKIDFRTVQVAQVTQGYIMDDFLVKAHGVVMIVAWVVFASTGTLIARRARGTFQDMKKPGGKDPWFYIHRFNMSLAALLTCAGFVMIVVQANGYSHDDHQHEEDISISNDYFYRTLHPPLGIFVLILTIVNPMMGVFRPPLDAPNRGIFKYTHWAFGMMAWITALAVICIGLDLPKAGAREESKLVLGGFVCYLLVMEILIRALPYIYVFMMTCCEHKLSCMCYPIKCCKCCKKRTNSYNLNPNNEKRKNKLETKIDVPATMGKLDVTEDELVKLDRNHGRITRCKTLLFVFHIFACCGFAVGIIYFFLFDEH